MESLHRKVVFLSFFLSFLHSLSSSFTPNASIFLACGSTSPVTLSLDLPPRTFNPDSNYIYGSQTSSAINKNSSSTSPLYTTARFSFSSFKYPLYPLAPKSSNILRLHFFPFDNLTSARFNVTALDRYVLLSNFSVSTTSSPTIKEFFLWIDSNQNLELEFAPQANSFAFINAIEVFTAPSDLLSNSNPLLIGNATLNGEIQNQAMETMYRVNMGGPLVTPANDTLWRTWTPDGNFLPDNDKEVSSTNFTSPNSLIYLPDEGSSVEIGPSSVYDTARVINPTEETIASNPNYNVNVTWNFGVDAGYNYLVRMHFCDFVSPNYSSGPQGLIFIVYIMNSSALPNNLQPATYTKNTSEPFYIDFVVHIQEQLNMTGIIAISISLYEQSQVKIALLNGLEIMKMNNSYLSLSGTYNPYSENNQKNRKVLVAMIIGITIGALLVAFVVLCITTVLCKRRSRALEQNVKEIPTTPWSPYTAQGFNSDNTSSKLRGATTISLGLLISFEQIELATDNFHENNLIGVGGFGKVYKGVLNGTQIAVKRASSRSNQGFPEFRTEIELLTQIRHKHLVSLIGYCDAHSEMILVYEYMEKGTLRNHLYGSNLPSLSWKQRLEICIGAAKGLHYLHTGYSQNIIHRDVKSTNILLGKDYLAKVSDFGLSKLGPSLGETHVSTAVKGSFGYLDPEYFKTQQITDKSDVYSFGVMLFEVLCARPVIDQDLAREQINLAEWALKWQKKGKLEKIIDPKLVGEINENSVKKFGEIAEKCLQEYWIDRPTIGDVLWNLEYCLQLQETEVRRDPYEDSGTTQTYFPTVPDVRRMPSSVTSYEGITVTGEQRSSELGTSDVFSQLVSKEGR